MRWFCNLKLVSSILQKFWYTFSEAQISSLWKICDYAIQTQVKNSKLNYNEYHAKYCGRVFDLLFFRHFHFGWLSTHIHHYANCTRGHKLIESHSLSGSEVYKSIRFQPSFRCYAILLPFHQSTMWPCKHMKEAEHRTANNSLVGKFVEKVSTVYLRL